MIAIIRITGDVGLRKTIRETLYRLKIRRKYSCVIIEENKINIGMIKKVRDFVAYGKISDEILEELIIKRGKSESKHKVEAKKIIEELKKGKKMSELKIKPFFRLHPPRKGIDSKKHFGVDKGVLGDNKEKINDLIRRML